MPHIDVHEARDQLLALVQRAQNGEDVVLTKGDRPLARLVAAGTASTPRAPGSAKGLIEVGDDFDEPLDDFQEYM